MGEFYKIKITRVSKVAPHKETFVQVFNGMKKLMLINAIHRAKDLSAIHQGDTFIVHLMDCYSFPLEWEPLYSFFSGTNLRPTTTKLS